MFQFNALTINYTLGLKKDDNRSSRPLELSPGESIQIFAEIENCSSRMVVPKAAIYQTQTFYAKGKMKEVKQLVANLRGESLSSGKTETWSGKMLKIPPVSPSILDCSIIRVEYSLMVSTVLFLFTFSLDVFPFCLLLACVSAFIIVTSRPYYHLYSASLSIINN